MKYKKSHKNVAVHYSCTSGGAIWIYFGSSGRAAADAFKSVCRREKIRIHRWCARTKRRQRNILRILHSCVNALPIMTDISSIQRHAHKRLESIANNFFLANRDLIEHSYYVVNQRKKEEKIRLQHKK